MINNLTAEATDKKQPEPPKYMVGDIVEIDGLDKYIAKITSMTLIKPYNKNHIEWHYKLADTNTWYREDEIIGALVKSDVEY